jgi:hypothetical protein
MKKEDKQSLVVEIEEDDDIIMNKFNDGVTVSNFQPVRSDDVVKKNVKSDVISDKATKRDNELFSSRQNELGGKSRTTSILRPKGTEIMNRLKTTDALDVANNVAITEFKETSQRNDVGLKGRQMGTTKLMTLLELSKKCENLDDLLNRYGC